MFLKYCLQGTGYLIERGTHAVTWVNHYDNLMQQLSIVRSILPRVKISAAGQSYENLMEMSQLLVNYQDIFWESYKSFLNSRVTHEENLGINGVKMIQCIERGLTESNVINFGVQLNSVRAGNSTHLLCYSDDPHLLPENIRGLKTLIDDITSTLTSVNRTEQNSSSLADKTTAVILQDVDYLVTKIVSERSNLNLGQRAVLLEECSQLCKRIDRAREGGSNISPSHKDRIALQKANLTSNQKAEEAATRKTEASEKARLTEAIKSAPTITLQKLLGFSNWLSWTDQCRHLLENISHDNTKCTIVMNSLSCREDF